VIWGQNFVVPDYGPRLLLSIFTLGVTGITQKAVLILVVAGPGLGSDGGERSKRLG